MTVLCRFSVAGPFANGPWRKLPASAHCSWPRISDSALDQRCGCSRLRVSMSEVPTTDSLSKGRSKQPPSPPDEAELEVFENPAKKRSYWITLNYPEFAVLCPHTGQLESARIEIRYVPVENCVSARALKFYLASFRNTSAFNDAVVTRILDDLVAACAPREMTVHGEFSSPEGMQSTAKACYPN